MLCDPKKPSAKVPLSSSLSQRIMLAQFPYCDIYTSLHVHTMIYCSWLKKKAFVFSHIHFEMIDTSGVQSRGVGFQTEAVQKSCFEFSGYSTVQNSNQAWFTVNWQFPCCVVKVLWIFFGSKTEFHIFFSWPAVFPLLLTQTILCLAIKSLLGLFRSGQDFRK